MTEQTLTTLIITFPAILIAVTGLIVAIKGNRNATSAKADARQALDVSAQARYEAMKAGGRTER